MCIYNTQTLVVHRLQTSEKQTEAAIDVLKLSELLDSRRREEQDRTGDPIGPSHHTLSRKMKEGSDEVIQVSGKDFKYKICIKLFLFIFLSVCHSNCIFIPLGWFIKLCFFNGLNHISVVS